MKIRHASASILVLFLVLAASPAAATDSHDDGKNEYAVIRDGLAPNKQMSLAAHGEREFGDAIFTSG